MFENYFNEEALRLCNDKTLVQKLWTEVKVAYSGSNRFYHNLLHLDHLLTELLPVKNEIHDWHIIIFSIAYHDVIYYVSKKDNEERSADYAFERLTLLRLTEHEKQKCVNQVLATKMHVINSDNDTNFFTDADLSILGTDPQSYSRYTSQIRKEYRLYPDMVYKPGRKKVLLHFLSMPYIFKTELFRQKFETQARANLAQELKTL